MQTWRAKNLFEIKSFDYDLKFDKEIKNWINFPFHTRTQGELDTKFWQFQLALFGQKTLIGKKISENS